MNGMLRWRWICLFGLLAFVPGLASCQKKSTDRVQGYVEGEFVYVASPASGALNELNVRRGDQATAGEPLFALDDADERAARDEAVARLAEARATLADLTKGKRPSEIDSLTAQIEQVRVALALSLSELERHEKLIASRAASIEEVERLRAKADQDRKRIEQLEAELTTAQLGARSDQIAAAESLIRALEAALAKAQWQLAQTRQLAPQSGLVFDTLYRKGEWVTAGKPVVILLPPENIKVRAFVPEQRVGALKLGDAVQVVADGVAEPFAGKLSFISPKAEYTPPVIYSQENRSKLVFLVEIGFTPDVAARLHPGQPVDVILGSRP
ncbi:MAG: HlyD family efflux transporter periplasmic adaptor subunit [Pirellulales bacterium]|nr:HlyD family efflux transporter periplasmic adaptor subunit [Pirellulales bacterium]